jgi:ATP-dependent Clp protease ATP-binding subunit ClpA
MVKARNYHRRSRIGTSVPTRKHAHLTEQVRRKPCRVTLFSGLEKALADAFHALDEKNIAGIARIQLKYLEKRMAKLDMTLEVSDAALALIAEAGFDPVFGARPLKRAIQERIENPLSRLILDGTLGAKDRVKVGVTKGQFSFTKG